MGDFGEKKSGIETVFHDKHLVCLRGEIPELMAAKREEVNEEKKQAPGKGVDYSLILNKNTSY